MLRLSVALVLVVPFLIAPTASAADYTWSNPAGGNWNTAGGWSPAAVPGAADNATLGALAGAYTVQINDTRAITDLTVSATNATLTQAAGAGSSLTVGAGGTFALNAGTYSLNGGTLTVNGAMTSAVGSTFNWTAGTYNGTGTGVLSGTTTVSGVTPKSLTGRLANAGTLNVSGPVSGTAGAVVDNRAGGVVDFQADGTAFGFGGTSGTFVNAGAVRKSQGTGTTSVGFALNTADGGAFNVQVGTLEFIAGGTLRGSSAVTGAGTLILTRFTPFTVPAGDTFATTGAGTLTVDTTLSVAGTAAFGSNVALTGGSIVGAGTATISGGFAWTGGAIDGPGTLLLTGASTVSGTSGKFLNGQLANAGTLTVVAGVSGTGTLNNRAGGVVDFQVEGDPFGSGGALVNAGTLRKSQGAGTTNVSPATTNTGTVRPDVGTLNFFQGVTNTGVVTTAAGATVAGTITTNSGGRVEGPAGGVGSYSGSLTFNSGGALAPGGEGAVGTVAVAGPLALSGGTLAVDVRGTSAVTNDRVDVVGSVNLQSGAQLTGTTTGATLTGATVLVVLSNDGTDAAAGTFAGLPQGGAGTLGGYAFQISYAGDSTTLALTGGNDILLYNFTPVPEPGAILGVATLACVAAARRRRAAVAA